MSKQLDKVLNFCTQHRYAPPMLTKVFAKLGHECWNAVRAAGISAAWRRVPITTVTITLVIGFWLYDYVSVSSAATASAPRASIAVLNAPPIAIQPVPVSQPTSIRNEKPKKTRRPHQRTTTRSAFQRERVGQNEVDYVANDVTIRLFTPENAPARPAHASRQSHFGKDVTVRYREPDPGQKPKRDSASAVTQAAERSKLGSK